MIHGTTSAIDDGLFVFWVNICFHGWKKEVRTIPTSTPSATEIFPVPSQVSENALLTAWKLTLERRAQERAIFSAAGETVRTFAEIEREAGEWEERLAPFEAGFAVGVQIGNSASWPAVLLALLRRRLVPVPIGGHVEGNELELVMRTTGAAGLVVAERGKLIVRHTCGTDLRHRCDFLKLTSGTTGAPRAVCFQAQQLVADCDNICATMGITERDLNFGVIPFSHSYGFSNLLTPLLCRGVPLVATEDRMPRAILDGLERSKATVFPGMPVFYDKLAALESTPELPHLRLCISAGAPLPRAVAEAFTQRFHKKIHTFYGSSECGGIGYDRSEELLYEEGFAGEPMEGVEITFAEGSEPGRIVIRGEAVGDGYFPETDEETLGGGRFIPGDLVRRTERGMFIAGRASDVINIAGRKLNPAEIEERIAAFSGVRQVVVFGIPSALRGEEPVACVAGTSLDRQALFSFCQSKLSQWQMPRDFWIVEEVPVNERGKISRRELAERYGQKNAKSE